MSEIIPEVSIVCLTYNHEDCIKNALDSFVMQETDFPYELVIHDDASTDKTAEIIKDYQERYPEIFKPILQKENQYSKKKPITRTFIAPVVKGKYIAMCEGDDYWTDSRKLQKQYDYMESHPECAMCVHNTVMHHRKEGISDKLFNTWQEPHVLSDLEVFAGWFVHTSSFFFRKEQFELPDELTGFWSGDLARMIWEWHCGEIVCLPDVMSVYNYGNTDSVLTVINKTDDEKIKRINERIAFLQRYIQKHPEDNCAAIDYTIGKQRLRILQLAFKKEFQITTNKERRIEAVRKVCDNSYYKDYLKEKRFKARMVNRVLYEGFRVYPLWCKIAEKILSRQ